MNKLSISTLNYLARGLPRCSHACKANKYQDLDYCDTNSKVCLLESDNECETFQEERNEYSDSKLIVMDSWYSALKKKLEEQDKHTKVIVIDNEMIDDMLKIRLKNLLRRVTRK